MDSKLANEVRKYREGLAGFFLAKDLKSIELLIVAVCLSMIYLFNLLSAEFHPDESFWIVSSVRFDKLIAGEFDSPVWTEKPFISYEVRPLPSYIVAISQRLAGIDAENLPPYWDWSVSDAENIARGAMPTAPTLLLSRLPMALITVLSLLVTILLLARAHSRLAAYLFAAISINAYFLLHLRRAMSEAALLFFTVLVLYTSYKLLVAIKENATKRAVLWSLLAGILSGMAGQSKLTGLACAGIPILGSLILISRSVDFSGQARRRLFLIVSFFVACTSLLMFVLSYPFFYENTVHRILTTFVMRSQVVESQVHTYAEQVIQSNQRLPILFQRIFEYPLAFHTNAIVAVIFHWINLLIVVSGITFSIQQIVRKQEGQIAHIVLAVGALICAVPMLWVPLDWDRYYLYPIFFTCIFFVIGFSELLSAGYLKWKKANHG